MYGRLFTHNSLITTIMNGHDENACINVSCFPGFIAPTVDLLHLTIHHPPPFFAAESLEMDPQENQCHEGQGM